MLWLSLGYGTRILRIVAALHYTSACMRHHLLVWVCCPLHQTCAELCMAPLTEGPKNNETTHNMVSGSSTQCCSEQTNMY